MIYGFVDPCSMWAGLSWLCATSAFLPFQVFAACWRKRNHDNDVMRWLNEETCATLRWGCELLPNTNQWRQSTMCPLKVMWYSIMWSLKNLQIVFVTLFSKIKRISPAKCAWLSTRTYSTKLMTHIIVKRPFRQRTWFMGLIWKLSPKT